MIRAESVKWASIQKTHVCLLCRHGRACHLAAQLEALAPTSGPQQTTWPPQQAPSTAFRASSRGAEIGPRALTQWAFLPAPIKLSSAHSTGSSHLRPSSSAQATSCCRLVQQREPHPPVLTDSSLVVCKDGSPSREINQPPRCKYLTPETTAGRKKCSCEAWRLKENKWGQDSPLERTRGIVNIGCKHCLQFIFGYSSKWCETVVDRYRAPAALGSQATTAHQSLFISSSFLHFIHLQLL